MRFGNMRWNENFAGEGFVCFKFVKPALASVCECLADIPPEFSVPNENHNRIYFLTSPYYCHLNFCDITIAPDSFNDTAGYRASIIRIISITKNIICHNLALHK